MPPMYWSTGSQWSTAARSVGASSRVGSVKRAKYQDESTKVSMVSVSRRAGRAALRAGTCFQVGMAVERVARLVEGDVLGQVDRQVRVGTGTTPQASQWMTGIGQPQ